MLKIRIAALSEVPETLHGEYVADPAGGFILSLDDSSYKAKIGEFRDNNIEANKQLELLRQTAEKHKGIDPAKYLEMSKKIQDIEDKKLIDAGQIDVLVDQKAGELEKKYTGQLTAYEEMVAGLKTDNEKYKTQYTNYRLNDSITQAANEVGTLRQGALTDVLNRSKSIWSLNENGVPVALNPDGSTIYEKDAVTVLTPQSWLSNLAQDSPYLFEGNTGGGPKGGGNPPTNPNTKTVSRSDIKGGGADMISDIASGKTKVVD